MILVLLPGLDGTGLLFKPFLACLPLKIKTKVIAYPAEEALDYEALVNYVRPRLPNEDFTLLAESFSGPVAFLLAQEKPKHLKSIIFAASFLSAPRPRLQKVVQKIPLFSFPIPKLVIQHALIGKEVEQSMIDLFKQAVEKVPAKILNYRLRQITKLELTGRVEEVKCSYIQAVNDKLVLENSLDLFKERIEHLNVVSIKGPHFILQAQAKICADFVVSEITSGVRSKK